MAAEQVQIRRDTAANIDGATPAAGEMAYDTTNKRIRIGDGSKSGGYHKPTHEDLQYSAMDYAAAGGTADALTVTLSPAPGALTAGMFVKFKATANNTGSATLQINALTAKTLKKLSSGSLANLEADDLVSGAGYIAYYDGTDFQVVAGIAAVPGLTSVSQGDLNTSTGTISGTGDWEGILPGGEYGFTPTAKVNNAVYEAAFLQMATTTSYVARIKGTTGTALAWATGGSPTITGSDLGTLTIQQRYVTSSPPFDMGDGQAAGFMFAKVNAQGDVLATYIADVPPWGYNGPTSIRADRIDPVTKKKYRRVMVERSLEEIADGASIRYEYQEITQAIKNADMGLIPHPFGKVGANETVVLINPYDDRVARFIEYQNQGGTEDLIEALHGGKIYFDNEQIAGLKGVPQGVIIPRMKFRYSGGQ